MQVSVATWNVNSIRARLENVTRWLKAREPDVLCLQELKVDSDSFPFEHFESMGYGTAINAQKTWNGVAILSRHPLESVQQGFRSGFLDDQKRFVSALTAGLRVINVYVPQGGDPSVERFRQKLGFLEELGAELTEYVDSEQPMVLVGDMNVAPEPEDVFDADELEGLVGFHPEERRRIRDILDMGFTDLLRNFTPEGKVFSWWDYRAGAFRRNRGMRLDLVITNRSLLGRAISCDVDADPRKWVKPSDHVPVVAVFDLEKDG